MVSSLGKYAAIGKCCFQLLWPCPYPGQDYAALQGALGLESGEAVLESFGCHLLQTYTCTNNPFTPDRQVSVASTSSWLVEAGSYFCCLSAAPYTLFCLA